MAEAQEAQTVPDEDRQAIETDLALATTQTQKESSAKDKVLQLHSLVRMRQRAVDELARAKENCNALLKQLAGRINTIDFLYGGQVEELTKEMLTGKKKSMTTPFGKVGFRKHQAKLNVDDVVLLQTWAEKYGDTFAEAAGEPVMRSSIVEEPNKTAIKKYVEDTGDVPNGCTVLAERDEFYIK